MKHSPTTPQKLINRAGAAFRGLVAKLSYAPNTGNSGSLMRQEVDKQKGRYQYRLQKQRIFLSEVGQDLLKQAIAVAEDTFNPQRYLLLEIYRYIIRDPHLKSQIRTAITNSLREPWVFTSGKDKVINEELRELFEKKWFTDLCNYVEEAEFWGTSLVEMGQLIETELGLEFDSVSLFPREHVKPETGEILITPSDMSGFPYREAPFNTWLIEAGNPFDLGLLHIIASDIIFKKFSKGDWSRSSEKWGDPLLVIKSASDDDEENAAKEEFAREFGKNGYTIVDKDDEVELLDRVGGDKHNIYKDFVALLNEEISKVVNGQTGTADQKSFVGSAEVHERILDNYTEWRLTQRMYFINEKLVPYLTQVNGGNSAYAKLKGHKWMPVRLLKPVKDPRLVEEVDPNAEPNANGKKASPPKKRFP